MWGKIFLAAALAGAAVGAVVGAVWYAGRNYTKINGRIDKEDISRVIAENLKNGNYTVCDVGLTDVSVEITDVKRDDGMSYVSLVWQSDLCQDDQEMNLCSDKGTSLYAGERLELSL